MRSRLERRVALATELTRQGLEVAGWRQCRLIRPPAARKP